MPVTRSRNGLNEVFDHANVTRFLFGDDDSSPFFHGNIPDDNFPTLVRREDQMVSFSLLNWSLMSSTCSLADS